MILITTWLNISEQIKIAKLSYNYIERFWSRNLHLSYKDLVDSRLVHDIYKVAMKCYKQASTKLKYLKTYYNQCNLIYLPIGTLDNFVLKYCSNLSAIENNWGNT